MHLPEHEVAPEVGDRHLPDPSAPVTAVGVVIPARNEVERIGPAIEAVVAACRRVDALCTIVVVDVGSTDDTAALALEALSAHAGPCCVLNEPVGRASAARRVGADVFAAGVRDPSTAWLLSTDADSIVPLDWVERFVRHHGRDELAVAGVVRLLDDADGRRVVDRWRVDYGSTIAPDGSHPHVHAANLGVRLDAYRRSGGFLDLDRIEDRELWDRLRAVGVSPLADASIVVATSARLEGRVPLGFAAALDRLYG